MKTVKNTITRERKKFETEKNEIFSAQFSDLLITRDIVAPRGRRKSKKSLWGNFLADVLGYALYSLAKIEDFPRLQCPMPSKPLYKVNQSLFTVQMLVLLEKIQSE